MLTKRGMARRREREQARAVLDLCDIPLHRDAGRSFNQLRPDQVQNLREAANASNYVRPKKLRDAAADRARCYFDHIMARAL